MGNNKFYPENKYSFSHSTNPTARARRIHDLIEE